MRRTYLWALLGILLIVPGGLCLGVQGDAPSALILDEFASRSFDTSVWTAAPENLFALQSDGAARLTYEPRKNYSDRESITTTAPLPEQYVVQVNMVGGIQVVEMGPPPPPRVPPTMPIGYGTAQGPGLTGPGAIPPAAGGAAETPSELAPGLVLPPREEVFQSPMIGPGQATLTTPYGRLTPPQPTLSFSAQISQLAEEAVAREERGSITVTGHYIKPTAYAVGPQVGVALVGQNSWLSVAFRAEGDPTFADEAGISVSTSVGRNEQQIARIALPAGEWATIRLEVDGASVAVKVNEEEPIWVTLPTAPVRVQVGDLGQEDQPFSVTDKVEYLVDDVRVYAGLVADLPADDYLAAGDWFLTHQDYANAAIEFARAVLASPFSGARVALAYARAFSQGASMTLPNAEQAATESQDSFRAHYYLGCFYLDMMRYDDAATELRKALAIAPDSPQGQTWMGLTLFRLEARFPDEKLVTDSQALLHLEAAVRLLPTSAEAHQALGLCLMAARQYQNAQDELIKALEGDQGLFDARLVLTSLIDSSRLSTDQVVTNVQLLADGNPSYPRLLLALLPAAPTATPSPVAPTLQPTLASGAAPPLAGTAARTRPELPPGLVLTPEEDNYQSAYPTAGALTAPPSILPPVSAGAQPSYQEEQEVEKSDYLRRANEWRDKGMLRPAVEDYRRWMRILLSRSDFENVARCAQEMAQAYHAADLPAMEAYALYLPVEPRNREEWPKVTYYVTQEGEQFGEAVSRALAGPLTSERRAWLIYIRGIVEMATTTPEPGWRKAISDLRIVADMESWPRRGPALIHIGNCYLALNRPFLAEGAFEEALRAYQNEAKRLSQAGVPVVAWEAQRIRSGALNAAIYVNLARQQQGKEARYDTGQGLMAGLLGSAGGLSAVVTDRTLDDALAAAKRDGKQVVAIFSASWCGWSVKLDKETLTDPRVQQELRRFHVVFVDYDKEKQLDSKYGIRSVPRTLILDKSGTVLAQIVGFRDAAGFLEGIRNVPAA